MAGRPPVAGRGTNATEQPWGEASWEDHAEELAFIDEDDRLPWLDSSDDVAPRSRPDYSRLVGLGLLGLAVAGLVGAGGWWLVSRVAEPAGDGSVIAAPEGPYKMRPADPGGKQHAGTGDTSFAVGEGQTREARIAESAPPPPPPAAPSTVAASSTSATAAAPAPSTAPEPEPEPAVAGVGVQVGAYYNAAAAERGWSTLIRQTEALQGVKHRVVRGVADIGTVYRLQAVAPDAAAANRLCAALRADGLNCQVKR